MISTGELGIVRLDMIGIAVPRAASSFALVIAALAIMFELGCSSSNSSNPPPPPTLSSIAVTPANPSIQNQATQQFTAKGTYSDNSTQDLTNTATWKSSAPGVATISSSGLAQGIAAGNTSISAGVGSISGSTTLTVNAATSTSGVPDWLGFLGDGSESSYSCNSSTCNLQGEHWFSSFNVASGATLVANSPNMPLVVRSTGSCSIAGTISESPTSGAGGNTSGNGDFGGGGGGGGAGATNGQAGFEGTGDAAIEIVNGGPGGAATGGKGQNGGVPTNGQYRLLISGGSFWPVGGAAGGSGGSSGGTGGVGGGVVILVCNSINFTGKIDVSGGAGGAPSGSNSGAGGGGGGGYVIFSSLNYIANTGTINTSGGTGGSCGSNSGCGNGGNGGTGWNIALTIP